MNGMNTIRAIARWGWLPVLAGLAVGCESSNSEQDQAPPASPDAGAEIKKVLIGPNVFLEVQGKERRVVVSAEVCLREGQLELFLCRKNTKEHEAILTADMDARDIHKALLAAGATEGRPGRYVAGPPPKYLPATGSTIKVSVRYQDKGRLLTVPAQSWVKNQKTGKALDSNWVFAGSQLVDDPFDPTKPKIYVANGGDVICLSNFETAMLDVPFESSKDNADLTFVAFTDRIPPLETKVAVILEPVPGFKKDK
jgi:hypothetical protein